MELLPHVTSDNFYRPPLYPGYSSEKEEEASPKGSFMRVVKSLRPPPSSSFQFVVRNHREESTFTKCRSEAGEKALEPFGFFGDLPFLILREFHYFERQKMHSFSRCKMRSFPLISLRSEMGGTKLFWVSFERHGSCVYFRLPS